MSGAALTMACARVASNGAAVAGTDPCAARPASAPPFITNMRPDSASVDSVRGGGVTVVVTGCGFAADRNDVAFGPERVRGIASADQGTTIRFPVPQSIRGGGEVPPMPIPAGSYDVAVETARGRSNTWTFTIH